MQMNAHTVSKAAGNPHTSTNTDNNRTIHTSFFGETKQTKNNGSAIIP